MRNIHVGKRESEAEGEEPPDKLRKTVRSEQEAPSAAASCDPYVALEYLASGETQAPPGFHNPRTLNVHISGPGASNSTKIPRKDPQ